MTDKINDRESCKKRLMALRDAMDVLNGKWKITLVATLCYYQKRRFSDFLSDVRGISNKMLSKELKEMEINKLVQRKVLDTRPVVVEYELTEYGQKLKPIIRTLSDWGIEHRKKIMNIS